MINDYLSHHKQIHWIISQTRYYRYVDCIVIKQILMQHMIVYNLLQYIVSEDNVLQFMFVLNV